MPVSGSIATNKLSDPTPRLWVLIPCAGSGSRAGKGAITKQYRPLAGQAMVLHTVAAFVQVRSLAGGVLVVAPGDRFFDEVSLPPGWIAADCGGATRADTVASGLGVLAERGAQMGDWVLVHDAARCLITPVLIEALIERCFADEVGGLLAVPLADTLKQSAAGRVQKTEEREGKWLAQTPQMFRLGLLAAALAKIGSAVTDESSAVESLGLQPLLVMGSPSNLKITWHEDFALAESILVSRCDRVVTALRMAATNLDIALMKGEMK
jgi:2-C-methyl-D-erythritol 4-phosphate cytidylyltransferase